MKIGSYFVFSADYSKRLVSVLAIRQDLDNSVPWGPCFALFYGLESTPLHAKDETSIPVNIDILSPQKIC